MKDFLLSHFDAIVYGLSAVLASFAAVAGVSLGQLRKIKKLLSRKEKSGYRIVCPHCHKESNLEDVHFILPDGAIDDNLNGVPDDSEN